MTNTRYFAKSKQVNNCQALHDKQLLLLFICKLYELFANKMIIIIINVVWSLLDIVCGNAKAKLGFAVED